MAQDQRLDSNSPLLSQGLLLSVAEELKMPLVQIARLSENENLSNPNYSNAIIQSTAETALRLLDNYILGVRLNLDPHSFEPETITVSSVLYDSCQELDSFAKTHGVFLELNVAGKFEPVIANRRGLQSALVSIGASLIEALPANGSSQLRLQFASHRSRYGIVAGVYADTKQLSNQALNIGRKLHVNSRQPMVNVTHNSGAGVFVADSILRAMNLSLTASRHHRLYGLGTVLQSNSQLQLV
jgi:hypothetical protein